MKTTYETLDEYLEDLDKIKERVVEETKGLDPEQVRAYFARARQEVEKVAGRKARLRKVGRKDRVARR